MTRQEFEDLREWVKHTEDDLVLLEKTTAELAGDLKVVKNTQKFIGWMCGLLLTANLALLAFILNKLYDLAVHLK